MKGTFTRTTSPIKVYKNLVTPTVPGRMRSKVMNRHLSSGNRREKSHTLEAKEQLLAASAQVADGGTENAACHDNPYEVSRDDVKRIHATVK